jgi:hypothetical protein
MFQFSGFAFPCGNILTKSGWVAPFGHPRISPPCGSPWLFAAWHVLLRLQEPRHPPCALVHLQSTQNPLLQRSRAVILLPYHHWNGMFYSVAFSAQHVKELIPGPCGRSMRNGIQNNTVPGTFQKGGVPAAPSGTATLLRLSPSYRFYP